MKLASSLILFTVIFLCELAAQGSWIKWMRRRHVSQVQKAYGTRIDESVKAKVPSMGGVVFLLIGSGMLISAMIQGSAAGICFWSYPLLAAMVGLADDGLKLFSHSSEGLRSMQKFALQVATTVLWFIVLAVYGKIPSLLWNISIGQWIWPFALFFAVGIQNSVNVTDGLDGLAAGCSAVTFCALMILSPENYGGAVVGLAISLGFLWHNCHPAQVFMGDAGAHFLAGLMASCAFMGTGGVLVLIPAGVGLGLEMLSVVIQLVAIHVWGKRVFLMSPIHHHFQLLGWKENQIVVRFWLIHGVLAALCGALIWSVFHSVSL